MRIVICAGYFVFMLAGLWASAAGAYVTFDSTGAILNLEEVFYTQNPYYPEAAPPQTVQSGPSAVLSAAQAAPEKPEKQARKAIPEADAYTMWGYTPLIGVISANEATVLADMKDLLKCKANPNLFDAQGRTALEVASQKDNVAAAKLLLANGAKAGLGTPLAYAKSAEMKALLKKHGAKRANAPVHKKYSRRFGGNNGEVVRAIEAEEAKTGKRNPSVSFAVFRQEPLEKLEELLRQGGDVNEKHPIFGTPLDVAVGERHIAYIPFLLASGADPDVYASTREPLLQAIEDNQPDIVKAFVTAKAAYKDAEKKKSAYAEALALAVKEAKRDIVRILLEAGADPNAKYGDSPILLQAARNVSDSSLEITQLLLDFGANPKVKDKDGANALTAAFPPEKALLLVRAGVPINNPAIYEANDRNMLHQAIHSEKKEFFDAVLKAKPGAALFRQTDENGFLPLSLAVEKENPYFVRALLQARAPISLGKNRPVNYGAGGISDSDQILIEAVAYGNLEIVCLLIDAGARLDPQGESGSTPLHRAVKSKRIDIVRVLLKAGADVNKADLRYGSMPLSYAVASGDSAIVSMLLEAGADPEKKDNEGKDAFAATEFLEKDSDIPAMLRAWKEKKRK